MTYTIDQVRYGVQRVGLAKWKPWVGESSNWGIAQGAVEAYALMVKHTIPGTDGARELLYQSACDLLSLTPVPDRPAMLADICAKCGIDLAKDLAFLAVVHERRLLL